MSCPGGEATRKIVSRKVMESLGSEGILVNIARGSVIDEAAMVELLQNGKLGAAGLDVFENEPNVPETLLSMDKVVLQPHNGSATDQTRIAMGQLVLDNLEAFFAGKPDPNPVNQVKKRRIIMPHVQPIEENEASPEVKEVFDDIKKLRQVEEVNNFWKYLANHPPTLRRTWESLKEVMQPGALDPLVKEMIYVAVSASNNCEYCIRSHTAAARKKGMTDEMFGELMAVVGMANETNRLVNGFQVDLDEALRD